MKKVNNMVSEENLYPKDELVQCVELAVKAVDKLGLNGDKEVQGYIRLIKYEIECGKLNCAYMDLEEAFYGIEKYAEKKNINAKEEIETFEAYRRNIELNKLLQRGDVDALMNLYLFG